MKIRVGVGFGTQASLDAETFFGAIDACESLGWDSVWLSERVASEILDPVVSMAAVAARTERLKFGTSVMVLPGRNPVLVAKELASIDVLSKGRLVAAFGLGSDVPSEHEAFGVDRRERAGRTEEATVLIKRLWTEDGVTHEGKYYSVHDLTLRPRPVQTPSIDVWFGGHSLPACRRVGRVGDGWLPSFIAPSEYAGKADAIRAEAAAHGREIEEEHYGALVAWLPSEEGAELLLDVAARRRRDVDPRELVVVGDEAALVERFQRFIDAGASKFVVIPLAIGDWGEALAQLYDKVAAPLEN